MEQRMFLETILYGAVIVGECHYALVEIELTTG